MRAADAVVSRPWLVLLLALLLCAVALDRLIDFSALELKLEIDPSIEALLPRAGPALAVFERMRSQYGSDDVLLVAWTGEDLFTPERLAGLKQLTRAVQHMAGVDSVDSLANALNVRVEDDVTEVDAYLHQLPTTRAAAEWLRDVALANPLLVGQLLAADGRGLLLVVHFDPKLPAAALSALVADIDSAARAAAAGAHSAVTGPVVLRLEIGRMLLHDLYRVMPLAVLATLLVAWAGFRSLHGLVLPLLANGVALVVTLACFAAAGHSLNFLTVILPPVVYVVGFAYAIHVVSDFDQLHAGAGGGERRVVVTAALHEVFLPLTLTAFTAAVGFSSLAISSIDSIRQFGLYASLGTLLGWVSALTVVPAGLMVMPLRRPRPRQRDRLAALAPALADFNYRHRRLILSLGALLAVGSLVAASRIEVSTDYLSSFSRDSALRRDFEQIGTVFAGAVPIEIVIESDIPQAFLAPEQLHALADIKRWLLAQPEIRGVYTLNDYLGIVYRALAPEKISDDVIAGSATLTGQLLGMAGSDEVRRFSTGDFRSTLVHLQSTAVETRQLMTLAARIEAHLASALPSYLHGQVTGSSYVIANTIDNITTGQIQSLSIALGVIYVVLLVMFGSLRVAALALLPNALPILVYFGILGTFGITLNLTTSLVADVVLGIAVDETIHFLSRFNEEARKAAREEEGIARALATVIRPATFTTVALCVGFLALAGGDLRNQVQFGVLSALILFISWALNFTFTPALALKLRFVTLWEVLTLDLGAAPQRSIPLFAGLSARQARIVALLGRLESIGPGTRLIEINSAGHAVCIVIAGELRVSLPAAGGHDQLIRTLTRGDLVGEVALFEGRRSANVDSISPAQVLWLSEESLSHIARRYPQIAAQLYRNIGRVLAFRLADRTAAH